MFSLRVGSSGVDEGRAISEPDSAVLYSLTDPWGSRHHRGWLFLLHPEKAGVIPVHTVPHVQPFFPDVMGECIFPLLLNKGVVIIFQDEDSKKLNIFN